MNIVLLYVEFLERTAIQFTKKPTRTELFGASLVAIRYYGNNNSQPRYYLEKSRVESERLVDESTFRSLILETKRLNPDSIIFITKFEDYSFMVQADIRNEILHRLGDDRGEPQNVRV